MKLVKLAMPTSVGSIIRTPMDGVISVSDEEADRLCSLSLLDGEPEDFDEVMDGDEMREVAPSGRRERIKQEAKRG